MGLNVMKCHTLARMMAERKPETYIKGIALLKSPATGAVYTLGMALKEEGLKSRVIDLSGYIPKESTIYTRDELYARRIFNELYVHDSDILMMYANKEYASVMGSITSAILKAAVDQTIDGKMSWVGNGEPQSFNFKGQIIFIIDETTDLSPDLLDRCLLVDVRM